MFKMFEVAEPHRSPCKMLGQHAPGCEDGYGTCWSHPPGDSQESSRFQWEEPCYKPSDSFFKTTVQNHTGKHRQTSVSPYLSCSCWQHKLFTRSVEQPSSLNQANCLQRLNGQNWQTMLSQEVFCLDTWYSKSRMLIGLLTHWAQRSQTSLPKCWPSIRPLLQQSPA